MSLNITHSDDLLLQWGEPGTRTAGMVRSLHPGAWRSPTEEECLQRTDDLLSNPPAHRARLMALAPDLIQALKDCLPLVDDALQDAKNANQAQVAASFEMQATDIRLLLGKAEQIPNSLIRQLKEQNRPDNPAHARFLNEGATLVIDGFDARVAIEAEEDNSELLGYLFRLINNTDPPNYQDKEPTHG